MTRNSLQILLGVMIVTLVVVVAIAVKSSRENIPVAPVVALLETQVRQPEVRIPIERERIPSEAEWDDPEDLVSSRGSAAGSAPPAVDVDLSREQVLGEMRALMASYLPKSRGRHMSEEDREKLIELGWLLAELEPDLALELLGEIKSRRQRGLVSYTLFKGLTQKDPQIARALYESIPSSRSHAGLRYTALSAICRTWSEDAPDEALQYALALEAGRFRSLAIRQVARGWTTRDPMDALARADAGIEGDEASTEWLRRAIPGYVARELLARTKESDPWETITWVMENLPESVQQRMLPALVGRCAEASPELAHELVDSMAEALPDPAQLVSEVSPALAAWAKHDVQAVLAWLDANLADDADYVKALQATFHRLNDVPERQAEMLTSAPLFYDDKTAGISMLTSYVMRVLCERAIVILWQPGSGFSRCVTNRICKRLRLVRWGMYGRGATMILRLHGE